jgi:hypothetical protein
MLICIFFISLVKLLADFQEIDINTDKFIVRYLHPDEHELDLTGNIDRIKDLLDLVSI